MRPPSLLFFVFCLSSSLLFPIFTFSALPPSRVPPDLASLIRKDHPRLFFNAETFTAVKARALGPDAALFARIRGDMDRLDPAKLASADYGNAAAEAALVWLVTGEEKYLTLGKALLERSIGYYRECYEQKKPVNWYSSSQINAWAAYDWMFNRLAARERKEWGSAFIDEVEKIQPTTERHYFYPQENWSGPTTGFYGNRSILWYAGLATWGEGVDDRSETFLAEGYRLCLEVLAQRRKGAGDDGGSASASLNYALAAYPWSVFNFFHTYRSATGRNIALDWPDVSYLPGYLYWNMLPGDREFGVGDSYHTTNRLSLEHMRAHIMQILYFFGELEPKSAGFAKWMMDRMPQGNFWSFRYVPFLLTERRDDVKLVPPAEVMPHARHFENMGEVFMRSGTGPEDTYALFMAGGVLDQHKHWDNCHFAIFRKGFLALDTGSRPAGQHTQHYYPRTVAHNCILIRMPGEQLPVYVDKGAGGGQRWGAPAPGEEELPIPNDGGQNELLGSRVVAFETSDDFSYVAGDATKAYSPEKCRLALRQFVFVHPDLFVVFDRVESTKAEYPKTFLLHTATEPVIEGRAWSASHEQGRLFVRTILPERAEITKIGGPGKQFWVDGRNYPMPNNTPPDTTRLLGQWRVEVNSAERTALTLFLHLLQASDISARDMVKSEPVKRGKRTGVRFSGGGATCEVLFDSEGGAGGHITIRRGGKTAVDRELARTVTPQKGLFGTGD
jgi:heparin/heparan-sulfate lyase